MLRRKPTAITLTTEDVAIYEDTRAREAQLLEQAAYQAAQAAHQQQKAHHQQGNNTLQNKNPNLAEERVLRGVKTREERLGIAGNGGRS
ncbi:hypothetical protein HYFRA_00012326 [Hymenoscyphus fraxineus]|uniref:Anaphase-promoting complex, subunit CDC26 n=1 Tax=Hymenoscyphus fraxineus TaxID=746836 RepID=A0A9N9PRF8_9HELO|nr:hypothetical protein HYFRA_00012326 [Hymenoscyphus fraxineus]